MISDFKKHASIRGEVSLLYIFIVLSMIIVSAFTISLVTLNSIKNVNIAESSARAQTAVDTYIEKAMFNFNWSKDGDTDNQRCSRDEGDVSKPSFETLSDGTKVTTIVDDGTKVDGTIGGCPSVIDVSEKNSALCVYAIAENNGIVKKKLAGAGREKDPNDSNSAGGCPIR